MSHVLATLLTYTAPFLLVLGFVVIIHELGHFWMARACGVAVDQFSLGFGKAVFKRRDRSGVEWRVGWIPLGGYVRFAGDLNAASVPDQAELAAIKAEMISKGGPEAVRRCYHFKPVWQRALIAVAGPLANGVLAILLFALVYGTLGEAIRPAVVTQVLPGTPAARAGFLPGDVVLKAGGHRIEGFDDLVNMVSLRAGVPLNFVVQRGSSLLTLSATPVAQIDADEIAGPHSVGRIGLAGGAGAPLVRHYSPVGAVVRGAESSWEVVTTTGYYLGRLVTGQAPPDQIGGVIGIARVTGKVAQQTVRDAPNLSMVVKGLTYNFIMLSALISVSIGLLNLLPVPMLDGGHLAFYAFEAVARRPLPGRIQDAGYRVGLALLVGFMLFAAWNDLQRFNLFHLFGGLFS